jgi:hypothetical protein
VTRILLNEELAAYLRGVLAGRTEGEARKVIEALDFAQQHQVNAAAEAYRYAARCFHSNDGELEFDSDAIVSFSDNGAYVEGWQWVDAADAFPAVETSNYKGSHLGDN